MGPHSEGLYGALYLLDIGEEALKKAGLWFAKCWENGPESEVVEIGVGMYDQLASSSERCWPASEVVNIFGTCLSCSCCISLRLPGDVVGFTDPQEL